MAVDRLQLASLRRQRHQLMAHAQEMLADDVQAGIRQQMMDVGDAAGDRVLDRDHGEPRSPPSTAASASSKVGQASGSMLGIDVAAGEVGVGAGLALKGDLVPADLGAASVRAWSFRLVSGNSTQARAALEIGGSIDTERNGVNDRHVDAHAGFQRAQLLQLLARSPAARAAATRSAPSAARR